VLNILFDWSNDLKNVVNTLNMYYLGLMYFRNKIRYFLQFLGKKFILYTYTVCYKCSTENFIVIANILNVNYEVNFRNIVLQLDND